MGLPGPIAADLGPLRPKLRGHRHVPGIPHIRDGGHFRQAGQLADLRRLGAAEGGLRAVRHHEGAHEHVAEVTAQVGALPGIHQDVEIVGQGRGRNGGLQLGMDLAGESVTRGLDIAHAGLRGGRCPRRDQEERDSEDKNEQDCHEPGDSWFHDEPPPYEARAFGLHQVCENRYVGAKVGWM